jgi:hypothetical protein
MLKLRHHLSKGIGMTTLANKSLAKDIIFEENNFAVVFHDGRTLRIPLAYFPRLLKASTEQRNSYIISGGGTGLHWEEIDEDILVENLLLGFGDTTRATSSQTYAA